MYRRGKQTRMYYFSDKLKRQLAQMPHNPLTVLEAPSGFGKTTAVREYLRENLPPNARQYWYTCLGEPASVAWKGICELLANINDEAAASLKKLEAPTMDTLMYMMETLGDFHCTAETYFVIDNYQLMRCDVPRELMSVFSLHGSPNLHMIFITQQLGTRQQSTVHNDNIHTIDSSAFFFDREGTASLFRMEGIRLSEGDLDRIYASTEGWVSAIRLQIMNYEETGSFDHAADIEHLVEAAIWNRLAPEEKDFLLSVSVMDSFTARQAAIMMERETLPKNIEELLKYNDFIRHFPEKSTYIIHNILQDYLRSRFYHHQLEDFQNRILSLAGKSFAAVSQYFAAAQFFLKVKDFDALLSLPFDGEYLDEQREKNLFEFIAAVATECPEETLCRYPFAMLLFAYQMLLGGRIEIFQKLYRLIGAVAERDTGCSLDEFRKIRGEFALLSSLTAYNDIKKMCQCHRRAWEILGEPSSLIHSELPYTFGSASILLMFWREPGQLDNTVRDMNECAPIYGKLTRGHGAGAASVMRAEVMLMRGEDDEAEILCHKALYDARSCQQTSICLCAELVLARIAVLRGDVAGYFTAVKNIQGYAKEKPSLYVLRMTELCLSVLSLVLGSVDNVAPWLCDLESINKVLYAPAVPYAHVLYSWLLLIQKRYNELYGTMQIVMDAAWSMNYMLPQVYHFMYLALAKHNSGNDREALVLLNQALAIALPDMIYLPFAQQEGALDSLLEASRNLPAHVRETMIPLNDNNIAALLALCKRQERGTAAIKKAIQQAKSPLTPREREVALLARDRFSARQIADRLYISEATVKTILKNTYNKLDIHSKSQLNVIEF